MPRISLVSLVLPLLTACDTQEGAFDDVDAIAASKVEVCHFNNGSHGYTLIDVAESSVTSHLDHGDTLYADDSNCNGVTDSDGEWVLVECMNDFGVGNVQELVEIWEASDGGIDSVQCMCDCGWCGDCSPLGCECADISAPPL